MNKLRRVALAGLALAVLASAALLVAGGVQTDWSSSTHEVGPRTGTPGDDADEVGLAVAESRDCLDASLASRSGWVHLSGTGADAAVSLDVTVPTDAGRDPEARLSREGSGEYLVNVTTDDPWPPANGSAVAEGAGCESVFRLQGSGLVPNVETLRVAVNGETVVTVENEGGFADLRELPEPIVAVNETAVG